MLLMSLQPRQKPQPASFASLARQVRRDSDCNTITHYRPTRTRTKRQMQKMFRWHDFFLCHISYFHVLPFRIRGKPIPLPLGQLKSETTSSIAGSHARQDPFEKSQRLHKHTSTGID